MKSPDKAGSGGTRIRTGDTMIFSHVLYYVELSHHLRKACRKMRAGYKKTQLS
jgi:hypothetical protein